MTQGDIPGATSVRRVAAAVALAGALLLSGCTPQSAPGPTTAPPTSAEPTPTPTPTPTTTAAALEPPQQSPDMERTDEAGAIAAAEYFMQLYEYSLASRDVTEWDRVSGQSCDFCRGVRDDVQRLTQLGHSYGGGSLSVEGPRVVETRPIGSYVVQLSFRIDTATELDATGKVVAEIAAEEGQLALELVPAARGWVLHGAEALMRDDG